MDGLECLPDLGGARARHHGGPATAGGFLFEYFRAGNGIPWRWHRNLAGRSSGRDGAFIPHAAGYQFAKSGLSQELTMNMQEPNDVYPEKQFQSAIAALVSNILCTDGKKFVLLEGFGL